jgi:hypothetical protein
MKTPLTYLMSVLFGLTILFSSASADNQEKKDESRLLNSGTVLKEILDVPDDIPRTCSTRQIVWSFSRQF